MPLSPMTLRAACAFGRWAAQGRCRSFAALSDSASRKGVHPKQPAHLSPELSQFMGMPTAARTTIVKEIWAYIRQHELQNPEDRRKIRPDHQLAQIFGTQEFSMFELNKLLTQHILSPAAPLPVKPDAHDASAEGPGSRGEAAERQAESFAAPDDGPLLATTERPSTPASPVLGELAGESGGLKSTGPNPPHAPGPPPFSHWGASADRF